MLWVVAVSQRLITKHGFVHDLFTPKPLEAVMVRINVGSVLRGTAQLHNNHRRVRVELLRDMLVFASRAAIGLFGDGFVGLTT